MIGDEPRLPLFDCNEVFVREVCADEAERLIEGGQAEPMTEVGIKLTLDRDYCPSCSCLTARDAQLIVGEFGESDDATASRAKLANWRVAR